MRRRNVYGNSIRIPSLGISDGKESNPAIRFSDDTDTGLYSSSNDVINFVTSGTNRLTLNTVSLTSTLPIYIPYGTVNNPSISFASDVNTGIYATQTDELCITTNGVQRLLCNASQFYINCSQLVKFVGGTEFAPDYTFAGDLDSGLFTDGTGDSIGLSTGGAARLRVTNSSITSTLQILGPAGSATNPTYSFSGDTNTGIYSAVADQINFVSNGGSIAYINASGLKNASGTEDLPGYSFTADISTGIYYSSSSMGFSTAGTRKLLLDSSKVEISYVPVYAINGSASAPAYSFTNDTNTGIYRSTTDTLTFSTGGTGRVSINTTNVVTDLPIIGPAGTVSLPSYTFNSDTNTGLYSYGADEIGIACGGTLVGRFYNSGFIMNGNVFTDLTPSSGTLHWYLRTNGGSLRNAIGMAGTESGSDAGSNLTFWNYTDAGAFKATVYTNERSTNYNTFYGRLWAGQTASITIPSLGFTNQTDCGMSSFYTDQIDFITNSVHRFSITNSAIIPAADATYNLGSGGLRMNTIFASVGVINTSQRSLKEDITDCTLGLDFINRLQPKKYKWKSRTYEEKYQDEKTKEEKTRTIEKTHSRYHYGLIADDVKDILDELKISTNDFAGYVDTSINEPEIPQTLGLNYTQFIPILIKAVQELKTELDDAKARITVLES